MVGSGEGKLVKKQGWVGYELIWLRVWGHGLLNTITLITRIV